MNDTMTTAVPSAFVLWCRPGCRGRWQRHGTAATRREALDMIDRAGLKLADW